MSLEKEIEEQKVSHEIETKRLEKFLEEFEGRRITFNAVFIRWDTRIAYNKYDLVDTLLIGNIILDGTPANDVVCDYFEFVHGKNFQAVELAPGDIIKFNARVKGNVFLDEDDYLWMGIKLLFPNKISKIGNVSLHQSISNAEDMSVDLPRKDVLPMTNTNVH